MATVPASAKNPTDHLPAVAPEEHPDGWELLRDPMDVEYWEQADLTAALAEIRTRGEKVALTADNLKTIGAVARLIQTVFAIDSSAFRAWLKSKGTFIDATEELLPLVYAYANALGEAGSSAS